MKMTILCLTLAVLAKGASAQSNNDAVPFGDNSDLLQRTQSTAAAVKKFATSLANSPGAWTPASGAPALIQFEPQLSPVDGHPTGGIEKVWIDGVMLNQDDGGVVPESNVHVQGYEFVSAAGVLYLTKRGQTSPVIRLGTFQTPNSMPPYSTIKAQPSESLTLKVETGRAGDCQSTFIDSEPQYFKNAGATITFADADSGTQAVLTARISTAMTPDLNRCEQEALGNTQRVYPTP